MSFGGVAARYLISVLTNLNLHVMPALVGASMITARASKAPVVIMDCRDKPGKDKRESAIVRLGITQPGFIVLQGSASADGGHLLDPSLRETFA
jgi:hypothetical protein